MFGKPCRLELDLPDDELVLVPEVTVDTCEAEAGALQAAYERLSVRLARHRDHEERRRTYLRRSRERHSRPMPLVQDDSLQGISDHLRPVSSGAPNDPTARCCWMPKKANWSWSTTSSA